MMTAGRRERLWKVAVGFAVFVIAMHAIAYSVVGRFATATPDKPLLVAITASLLLAWLLMLSQAMESMTRAFYARANLDLILASPVAVHRLFAVRITTVALSVTLMALPLAAPFINMLVVRGGWRWLGAYATIIAVGAAAGAFAVALTAALFQVCGPKRTRLVAQVVAPRSAPSSSSGCRWRQTSPRRALRRKEWMLLRRDPWLVSQTLMQMFYLVPPAVLLWRSFSNSGGGAFDLLVPVLVMAAGHLAGGLAWLTISGEDAPDLGATAPITPRAILRAKVEAVLGLIALVFAPLVVILAVASPRHALVTGVAIVITAAAATAIQLWFRSQAKRSQFRRRQGRRGSRPLPRRFPRSPGPALRQLQPSACRSRSCRCCSPSPCSAVPAT